MPSFRHQVLVELFRETPELAAAALDSKYEGLPFRVLDADLSQLLPTEFRADLVVVVGEEQPQHALIIEVQLRRDPDKRWAWWVYAAAARARHRCRADVVVVTPEIKVASWAARPQRVGMKQYWAPLVLGPEELPAELAADTAQRSPEFVVLCALAHARSESFASLIEATFAALKAMPEKSAAFCYSALWNSASKNVRRLLENEVAWSDLEFVPQSPMSKRFYGQGREKGREEGRAVGLADALLLLLRHRNLVPDSDLQRTITRATEEQLNGWLIRATTATDLDDVFSDH